MKILAIETSCDDTAVAVLENDRVLSSIVSSQIDLHKKWGGVVPDVAKRAHQDRIKPVIAEALKRASKTHPLIPSLEEGGENCENIFNKYLKNIDVIAVTQGPGLAIALGVGIGEAKELAEKYNKKLVAVNHIEGHILSNFLKNSKGKPDRKIEFPALILTVSGGHSDIVLMNDFGKYKIVGETLDDAGGEALDKASKMMGLGYPGGPVIERLAKTGDEEFLNLPRPMKGAKGFDYSFSGLKTSFYYTIKDWSKEKIGKNLANLAASFQVAVFDSLMGRYKKAIEEFNPKTLLVSGGVSANMKLRRQLRKMAKEMDLSIFFPYKKEWTTDNAAMIGVVAYHKALRGEFVEDLGDLDREARLKLV